MVNSTIRKLFRWRVSGGTIAALLAGVAVLALSAVMIPLENLPWARIAVRDIGQVFILGILIPLLYIHRSGKNWAEFGLSLRKWLIFLLIDLVLGAILFFMFLSKNPPPHGFHLSGPVLWSAAYVMVALCFELVFFYAFLRTLFERAFGIVPGIVLAALFYTFHHVGFQPEYGKLIFVGLLYATVYRLGNSALLVFPFFLGIGGIYDVLIQSQKVSPILFPEIRTLYLCLLILVAVGYLWRREKTMKGLSTNHTQPIRIETTF
jgi:membrane protease YdiL (CAAX protease family)